MHARANGGRWLLRIEDVDTTRCQPKYELLILRTLEHLGFEWQDPVLRQSSRLAQYAAALEQLTASGAVFRCQCSRRAINDAANNASLYCVSRCSERQAEISGSDFALRWQVGADTQLEYEDLWQGPRHEAVSRASDVVLRRRDGLHAYHLAVVVDDADQGVTQVVRGADLLASTAWHILLQNALRLPTPSYGHLPLLTAADGSKLSKSAHAVALEESHSGPLLHRTLCRLGQLPPTDLAKAPVREIWSWAFSHWQPQTMRGVLTLPAA